MYGSLNLGLFMRLHFVPLLRNGHHISIVKEKYGGLWSLFGFQGKLYL